MPKNLLGELRILRNALLDAIVSLAVLENTPIEEFYFDPRSVKDLEETLSDIQIDLQTVNEMYDDLPNWPMFADIVKASNVINSRE